MQHDFLGWHTFQFDSGSFEIFAGQKGYYWAAGFPGCPHDSEPSGPFPTTFQAFCDAWNIGQGLDVEHPDEVAAAKAVAQALYWAMGGPDDLAAELPDHVVIDGDQARVDIENQRIEVRFYPDGSYDARIVR